MEGPQSGQGMRARQGHSGEARREMGRGAGTLVTGPVMVTVAVPQHFPTREDEHGCPMGTRHWIWPCLGVRGSAFPWEEAADGCGVGSSSSQLGYTGGRCHPQGPRALSYLPTMGMWLAPQ